MKRIALFVVVLASLEVGCGPDTAQRPKSEQAPTLATAQEAYAKNSAECKNSYPKDWVGEADCLHPFFSSPEGLVFSKWLDEQHDQTKRNDEELRNERDRKSEASDPAPLPIWQNGCWNPKTRNSYGGPYTHDPISGQDVCNYEYSKPVDVRV